MPLNITTPVRCSRCGEKFMRDHARQVKCVACRPNDAKAKAAAARPVAPFVSVKLTARGGFPHDAYGYTLADRKAAVTLALKLARTTAKAVPDARGSDAAGLVRHVADLLIYARSVANGVVPGELRQSAALGFVVEPCDGTRNPCLQPRSDGPETLAEAEAADLAAMPRRNVTRSSFRCPLAAVTHPGLVRSHRRAVAQGRQGCTCKDGAA